MTSELPVRRRIRPGRPALSEQAATSSGHDRAEPATLEVVDEPLTRGFLRLPGQKSANPPASAGGHVENDETVAEAALREVAEETGLAARLLPGPSVPLPAGFPHTPVVAPWYVCEMRAGADNHTREPHRHVDHVFLAIVDGLTPRQPPVHEVRWFTEQEMAEVAEIAEDSRLQAKELFGRITEFTAPAI